LRKETQGMVVEVVKKKKGQGGELNRRARRGAQDAPTRGTGHVEEFVPVRKDRAKKREGERSVSEKVVEKEGRAPSY